MVDFDNPFVRRLRVVHLPYRAPAKKRSFFVGFPQGRQDRGSNFAAAKVAAAFPLKSRQRFLPLQKDLRELAIITPQAKPRFCAAGLNLRIPALLRKGECAGAITVANCPRRGKPRGQPQGVPAGCSSLSRRFLLSVQKKTCELFYSFPSDCGVTEKVLEMPSRA